MRGVSAHSISLCAGEWGLVWYGTFPFSAKISFFALCGERFYSVRHRGRVWLFRDTRFVWYLFLFDSQRDTGSGEGGGFFFLSSRLGDYPRLRRADGLERSRR